MRSRRLAIATLLFLACDDDSGSDASSDAVLCSLDQQGEDDPCGNRYAQPRPCSFDYFGDDQSGVQMHTRASCGAYSSNSPLNNQDTLLLRTYNNCDDSCADGAQLQLDMAGASILMDLTTQYVNKLQPMTITEQNAGFKNLDNEKIMPGVWFELIQARETPGAPGGITYPSWVCLDADWLPNHDLGVVEQTTPPVGSFTVVIDEVTHDGASLVEVHGSFEAICPPIVVSPPFVDQGATGLVTFRGEF